MKWKKEKIIVVGIMGILLIAPTQVLGLDNGYARIVYNVSGLQDYQLHWNDRFPPNSTLMIYAEANGINHRREVGVDYIFIIKDSNDNIIDTTVFENRFHDYRVNDFVKFSRDIDNTWEDGTYVAEVHIFDRLNDTGMDQYYQNVSFQLLHGGDKPDIPYMNRSDISNNSDLKSRFYKEIIQNFYVDKYADKYPANRFMVENMDVDRETIAPGMPIQVSANVTNTFYDIGDVSLDLVLDNQTVGNMTAQIAPYFTKTIIATVPAESTVSLDYGNHTLEIVPTSYNTVGFNLMKMFTVAGIAIPSGVVMPVSLNYKDIQTDKFHIVPGEAINITVTVENKGRSGFYPIGIMINNVPYAEKNVSINVSEVKDVNFTATESEIGEYRVSVNNTNLSKIFFVENPVSGTPSPPTVVTPERAIPKIFTVVGLAVLIVLIYIVRKRFVSKKIASFKEESESSSEASSEESGKGGLGVGPDMEEK